ncbi:DNA repair protein RecO [Dokdonella fugitiva]|jgi:DNA repair protein RecO (recombination protein O)|uniref:DNA repair protein RecO n=1 Tax=Dokdonella fugitiva TaxID=328517 RepID=A0A4R2I9J3_9GAMM|nr:DNA repair protein RecO [Dokdonella fugitiva]TCO40309.1 DNA replication and repair protein RecO [Dokdonella fugitiva]
MRVDQQPGYILHARAYRETSLLLDVFSRDHGRVGLVARGVRRERSRLPRGVLQPLQPLLLDWVARGELGALVAAEAASAPFALAGDRLFSAMYVNELVMRLCARNDAHPLAFAAYAQCLDRLAGPEPPGWTLRRFERDLLADLGYALVLDRDAEGRPLLPHCDYVYEPEAGAHAAGEGGRGLHVAGAALLAYDADRMPDATQQAQLRRLMRGVIRHHLGGGELNAWTWARAAAQGAPDSA